MADNNTETGEAAQVTNAQLVTMMTALQQLAQTPTILTNLGGAVVAMDERLTALAEENRRMTLDMNRLRVRDDQNENQMEEDNGNGISSRSIPTVDIIQDRYIFKQLQCSKSGTYSYILADSKTLDAIIIDPVDEYVDRDLRLFTEMGVKLKYAVNTHVHSDHITGSGKLKAVLPELKSIISEKSGAKADIIIKEGDQIKFGNEVLDCLETPGHTNGCMTYVSHKNRMLFTGDTLLIRGCGRTDFQQGSANTLYESIHKKIFTLPKDYLVYPAHDYKGQNSSTIGEEKIYNPGLTKNKEKFVEIMNNLNLAVQNMIDITVPANLVCGIQE